MNIYEVCNFITETLSIAAILIGIFILIQHKNTFF